MYLLSYLDASNENLDSLEIDEIHSTEISSDNDTSKCQYCLNFIRKSGFQQHLSACKVYFKFMKKSEDTFKCNLCPYGTAQIQNTSVIYKHLREKHQDEIYSIGK